MSSIPVRATVLVCFAVCHSVNAWPAERDGRPNVIIVLADDLTYSFIGCYGNPDVRTPNIDRLARDGMQFDLAYTSTAMCSPTRAQLYTGLFPVRNGAYPNHSGVRPGVRSLPHYLSNLGYRVGLNGKKHVKPAEAFPFEEIGGRDFNPDAIRQFVIRDNDQPFCLVVASRNPHAVWDRGDSSVCDPAELTLPETFVDTPETRAALCRCFGEVTELDREMGETDQILREAGLTDNTIFVFTSEQGAGFPGAKWTCYEDGLRVGLVVRWPGVVAAGSHSSALVHYIDVVPTLVEAAGGEAIAGLDGRSFLSVLQGQRETHRSVTYGIHTQRGAIGSPKTGYPVRSIRAGQYKYIMNLNHSVTFNNALILNDKDRFWNSWVRKAASDPRAARLIERYINRPAEELYDLDADPAELRNLAGDPDRRATISRLREQLLAWMDEQGDRGMQTELDVPNSR